MMFLSFIGDIDICAAIARAQLPDEKDSAESLQSLVNRCTSPLEYSCHEVLIYALDAMPGHTDLMLVTTRTCPVEYTANECLSYERLKEPRELLSYKKLGSGFGSSQRLFDDISSMIDHIEENVTSGKRTQKFINIWCPPCCHMLMTAEVIALHFYRGTGERSFMIHVVAGMPAGCCKDTSLVALVQKMQTVRKMVDDSNLRKDQDTYDARPFYNYGDLDHSIYNMEAVTNEEFQAKAKQGRFVEGIVNTADRFARLSRHCYGIILAEADLVSDEWKHCSPRFQPYARPFQPNQYFSLHSTDFTWNPKAGLTGGLEPTYEICFRGTWA